MYRAELEQQQVNNIDKMMSTQFPAWFEKHVSASFTTYSLLFPAAYLFIIVSYSLPV